ncbi:hypothetical protein B0T26DRAFT_27744 [Lasiosphaeria miniovina]|uniref:Uncharacterized protein n=1 Tax=Lasiosphaeria miniovina TaxID=1954250 RepID=A0AA40BG59_9PEZI|nr:uncharacterized protein B0T26DRAFT_27744 [Lasiosphaeria miniovina]KAK0733586.1 hypothetical protein B0T26DRAFT_27744 [Lasiosphaeria miniovina]
MMAGAPFKVPEISPDDYVAFHEAHFSRAATHHFETHFLRPNEAAPLEPGTINTSEKVDDGNVGEEYVEFVEYEEFNENANGLGFYADGVKRCLTDADIAWFREWELKTLRGMIEATPSSPKMDIAVQAGGQLSDGEISSHSTPPVAPPAKKKKRKRGNNSNNHTNTHAYNHYNDYSSYNDHQNEAAEPIDLRKRTWDVVDKGLETLDYEDGGNGDEDRTAQRRRISYDD